MESSDRRFDGYLRVSRVAGRTGPSYISPTIQRDAIKRWADYQNVTIDQWHLDEDHSGGTQNRPGLREAIERVENGSIEGIACWKLSRFARNVAGALHDLERIRAAGGDVVFVEEQIDTRGPIGQFILTILLAVATLERDNLTAGFEVAKQLAVERGAKISPTPYGYARTDDGLLEIDDEQAEHVAHAYRLAASRGLKPAVDYLQANAVGRRWTTSTVRRLLANRTYLGEQRYGEQVNPDAHLPVVSRPVWEAAQSGPVPRNRADKFPLSGIARCGTCGSVMVGGRAGKSQRTYRCSATLAAHRGERCPRGAHILADSLEQHVRSEVRAYLRRFTATVGDVDADRVALAERMMIEAEAELDAFAGDLTLRRALGSRYREHMQARVDEVERARGAYREQARRAHSVTTIIAADLVDTLSAEEFSALLRGILSSIIVQPGRGNVAGRVRLIAVDDDGAAGVAALEDGG